VEGVLRLPGFLILALQDPAVGSSEPTTSSIDILSLILEGSYVGQFVLLVLLIFSAVSWGIIIYKNMQLKKAARQSATFLDVFRKSSRFSEVQAVCSTLGTSPLADSRPEAGAPRPTLKSLDAVDRALLRASTVEVSKLEHRVSFLATTASITPYIGLFGTVWGIIMAFQSIGAQGSTSLAVVAPPIAEALVATAAGLFAAIPAVYFYNDITSQVKRAANEMDDFSMEFLTIAERNFT
jgi:biopolymer transport protein TolQ